MFENHKAPEADKILRVMKLFADDPREGKIDLGVGVYRTPEGNTPESGASAPDGSESAAPETEGTEPETDPDDDPPRKDAET